MRRLGQVIWQLSICRMLAECHERCGHRKAWLELGHLPLCGPAAQVRSGGSSHFGITCAFPELLGPPSSGSHFPPRAPGGGGGSVRFQIRKRVPQGCILSSCLFNFYAEFIREMLGWMKHKLESETCIISYKKRIASPGSMQDTGCLGLVHWDGMRREVGGGFRMGRTCTPVGRFMLMYGKTNTIL